MSRYRQPEDELLNPATYGRFLDDSQGRQSTARPSRRSVEYDDPSEEDQPTRRDTVDQFMNPDPDDLDPGSRRHRSTRTPFRPSMDDDDPRRSSMMRGRQSTARPSRRSFEDDEPSEEDQPTRLHSRRDTVDQFMNPDPDDLDPGSWRHRSTRMSFRPSMDDDYPRKSSVPRVSRLPSIMLPTLRADEKRFFDLVAEGDVESIEEFLRDVREFNINCVNFEGLSPLHVAVRSHQQSMVSFLLQQPGIDVKDCALHAVRENQEGILELIVDHQTEEQEGQGVPLSPDFPSEMTPLMLAAQCGHYEIIRLLLNRNHNVGRPHKPDCCCEEVCRPALETRDGLTVSTEKLNIYRAITNPAYICNSSDDPILTAFEFCSEMKACSKLYREFRSSYLELAQTCREFAVDLIASCRTSEEIETILRQQEGCDYSSNFLFPRLMLAIDHGQKEFVAHPNVQQALREAWRGDWYDWERHNQLHRLGLVALRIPLLPLIVLLCIFAPGHALAHKMSLPVNKLLSSIAAYIVFLIIIFIESNQDKTHQKRGPPSTGLEVVIIIFVIAHVWSSMRLCMMQGARRFFCVSKNWYDLVTQLLFIFTFLFWLTALVDVNNNDDVDLERKYWHHLDPALLSEGFFTVATIFAFGRLLLLLQLNYHIGPFQVAIGKMAKDFAKFIIIFVILIGSFAAGLCHLYQYYDGMIQVDTATGDKVVQATSFVSLRTTFKTLFWAVFCMSGLESADVVIENLSVDEQSIINQHDFTEAVGYICFALFEIVAVVVILNMLVGVLCNTFTKVIDNVDVEWTFGRTETYLAYIGQTTLPPPFNLIPTANGLASVKRWFQPSEKTEKKPRFSLAQSFYVETTPDEALEEEFQLLMPQLAQRYFQQQSSPEEKGGGLGEEAVQDEILEMKQILRQIRGSSSVTGVGRIA